MGEDGLADIHTVVQEDSSGGQWLELSDLFWSCEGLTAGLYASEMESAEKGWAPLNPEQ